MFSPSSRALPDHLRQVISLDEQLKNMCHARAQMYFVAGIVCDVEVLHAPNSLLTEWFNQEAPALGVYDAWRVLDEAVRLELVCKGSAFSGDAYYYPGRFA